MDNPLAMIDPNGDSVKVKNVSGQAYILGDLSSTTGLSLTTDENGNIIQTPTIKTKVMGEDITMGGVVIPGEVSSTARSFLETAIISPISVNVKNDLKNYGTETTIHYNSGMIGLRLLQNIPGLDSRTAGFAMTFFHELTHTNIGQVFYKSATRLYDPEVGKSGLGDVVPKMNIIPPCLY